MERTKFATYMSELSANEKVEFPNRDELIDFFSTMIGRTYQIYLNSSVMIPSAEKTVRLSGEPQLISFLAKEALEQLVPDSGSAFLFLKKWMRLKPKSMKISTTAPDDAFYSYLLKSLNQEDDVEEVFPTNMEFELEGDTVLYGRYC